MLKLYENIKKYRQLKGWSQDELAAKVGYKDRTIISKIESGNVDLPQSKIITLAKAFGVSPGELMGNDGCTDNISLPSDSMEKLSLLDEWGVKAVVDTIDHEYERCKNQDIAEKRKNLIFLDEIKTKEEAALFLAGAVAFDGAINASDEDLIRTANSALQKLKEQYK